MSGSGKLWVSFEQNCQRTQGVHSENTWWVIWQVSFEQTHNLPTGQSGSELITNSQQTLNLPTR